MRNIIIALALLIGFASCSVLPKEVRKENRAKAKIYRLSKRFNLQFHEIIEIRDTIIVPSVSTDTVFGFQELRVYDTLRIDTGRLSVRVVRLPGDSIFITGACQSDTIHYTRTVYVDRPIVNEANVWLIKLWRWAKTFWWLLIVGLVLGGLIMGALRYFKII